ncbi:hypothetical protein EAH89_14635 [Roseomonas nepalensis]|uniref:Uncharacterized protein n=1 Tax=Muricoccus nepalensis TaxID=1854500 RepID=A0A502G160_9PROT|nr:hypothetical protein [Roseomonas nepalensis]TPG55484.1 hypothetical protein EAH89_14635 [Roseomonas nepalensis]
MANHLKVLASNQALRLDSGCIEAHSALAEDTTDQDMARLHLEKAVRIGQDLWHPLARARDDFA